jgi:hypothetical protein
MLLGGAGFHHVPGARVIPIRPSPLIISWLAPQPVGVVPPRYFGLPENYFFGFTPKEVFGFALGEAAAQGERERKALRDLLPLAERLNELRQFPHPIPTNELAIAQELAAKVEAVRAASEYLRNRVPSVASIETDLRFQLLDRYAVAAGQLVAVTTGSAAAFALPTPFALSGAPVQQQISDAPTTSGAAGSPNSPFAPNVPSASIQPQGIEPVNDAAKRNQDNADGIRRDLVHERADP